MSTTKFFTIASVLLLLALLTGCSRSAEQKVVDAKATVVAAKQEVRDAEAVARDENQQASARAEWLAFKNEAEALIATNDRIIEEYKSRMTSATGKLTKLYDKRIDVLETQNKSLKAKLNSYQENGKSSWEKFKVELNHDLADLGTSLKAFTVDNKK